MGKKRKAGQPFGSRVKVDPAEAGGRAQFDINEEFNDSEDDFQPGKDQILIDNGPDAKRRRRTESEDAALLPSDEEVLGYESSDIDEESLLENHNNQDGPRGIWHGADRDDVSESTSRASANEEDLGDNLRDWGTTRQSYYDADVIETEADALEEEAEAKRLQSKRLEGMKEADFGFDKDEWAKESKEEIDKKSTRGTVYEKLPDIVIPDEMSDAERLKIMKTRYPEFEYLAKDFLELEPQLEDLRRAARATEVPDNHKPSRKQDIGKLKNGKPLQTPFAVTKFRALSSYLGSIAMYFALLTATSGLNRSSESRAAVSPLDLRNHPIILSLVRSQQLWTKVKEIPLPPIETITPTENIDMAAQAQETQVPSGENATSFDMKYPLQPKPKKKRASKSQKAAMAAKEAQQAIRLAKTEADLAELSSLLKRPSKGKQSPSTPLPTTHQDHDHVSDFGDEAPLTAAEAAEKVLRKKSLRFYTSQIAQKANRRGARGRDAGGDTDLPYKERVIDKRERLNREAQKRGRGEENRAARLLGENEDGESADEGEARMAKEIRREADAAAGVEGYYREINSAIRAKKESRKAAKHGDSGVRQVYEGQEETVGPDGKRAIGYAIQKNKGLAPKRSKDVRNPRVKKKKKYEEKRKKLGSVRQVYKGGEGRGGYGGELTGINRSVVRSVKL